MLVDVPNSCEFSAEKFKLANLTTVVGGNLFVRESFKLYPHFVEGAQIRMPSHFHFG